MARIRHKWKRLKPAGSRELERKRCVNCGLMVRRTRDGRFRDTETRLGRGPWVSIHRTSYRIPVCTAREICKACNGVGLVEFNHGET